MSFSTGGADVWQFKGIKYGSIPARFRQAVINETFPAVSDATSFGPKCPQVIAPFRLEGVLIGKPPKHQPHNAEDVFDEFECLNLNITSPSNAHLDSAFPVMVYIHGGGGYSGANSDWWCDGSGIVSKSMAMGNPVVHVAINYRLAALGNLGSEELRKEHGEADGGNFAYYDMVLAKFRPHLSLEWIYKHISPFGGSPTNITLYGESAGSLATETQLHSLLPARFSRCILQPQVLGAPIFSQPETIATKSAIFTKIKEHLSVQTVKQLQEVPYQDVLDASNTCDPRAGFAHVPMIDGILLDENWRNNFQLAHGTSSAILVGNTAAEGSAVSLVLSTVPKPAFPPSTSALIEALQSVTTGEKPTALLNAYGLQDSTPLKEVRKSLLLLVEDMMWHSPTQELISILTSAKTQSTRVYQYTFAQPSPFAGPFQSLPNHALDLAYLHGSPEIFEGLDDREMHLQASMKAYWVAFANGERIWGEGEMWEFGPDVGGAGVGSFLE
ncbi:Lipase, partial [Lachnellula suecica]